LLATLDKFCTLGIEAVKKPELQQSPPIDVSEAFKKRAFSHFVAAIFLLNLNEKMIWLRQHVIMVVGNLG
jgi:hypothetical protein